MKKNIILFIIFLLLTFKVIASEYYVSLKGNDNNFGTRNSPFRTIQKAADIMQPGDVCIVMGGIYREIIRPKNSGQKGKPIQFVAAEGEEVIISGLELIKGWSRHQGQIYKATVEWDLTPDNQLFYNGEMMIEARWPNKINKNIMDPEAALVDSGSSLHIVCNKFPDSFTSDKLNGGVLWSLSQSKWSAWTSIITGFEPDQKTIYFKDMGNSWWIKERHNPGKKHPRYGRNEFIITGPLALLDTPGEWAYDSVSRTLYFWPPDGQKPGDYQVEFKRRHYALDLSGKSYIYFKGFKIIGATIKLEDASYCLIDGIRARYISHTRGGNTVRGLGARYSVLISGRGNTIRNSEIAYSSGGGITLEGTNNAVINCYIHDINYFGSSDAIIQLDGFGHLISHNTFENSGRSCMRPNGAEHLIQYNIFANPGMITHDLGCFHGGGHDGGNTVIRYNIFHGNTGSEYNGIYFDNYVSNYIVHHNVVWQNRDAIRLNRPTRFCMIFNNTVLEGITNRWGPWKGQMTQSGTFVVNNQYGGLLMINPEVIKANNQHINDMKRYFVSENLAPGMNPLGRDKGLVLPGINEIFEGSAPDCGAYEGENVWKAGHNFYNNPEPKYEKPNSYYRNYLVNAGFEYSRYKGAEPLPPFYGWKKTFGKHSVIEYHEGFNFPAADSRFAVHGNSVHLQGEDDDGIEQTINGLTPERVYIFSAYVRLEGAKEVELQVQYDKGKILSTSTSGIVLEKGQHWRLVTLPFQTGQNQTTVTVAIVKRGSGDAYVDDCGVVPMACFTK